MQLYAHQRQVGVAILVLGLLSFSNAHAGVGILAIWPFLLVISGLILLAQSLLADAIAQVFGHQAQSMRLFQWLTLSYIPLMLFPAIRLLLPSTSPLLGLSILLVYLAIVLLQVATFRRLYGVGNWGALGLTFGPLIFFIGLFLLLMICVGVIILLS